MYKWVMMDNRRAPCRDAHDYSLSIFPLFCVGEPCLKKGLDLAFHLGHIVCRLEAGYDISFAVDEEFCKIPLNITAFAPARHVLVEDVDEDGRELVSRIETFKSLFAFEPSIEGKFSLAIDFGLAELGEVYAKFHGAELCDLFVRAWGLSTKLVTRDVEDFETCGFVALIEGFELLILRGETAFGGGIDDEQNLAFILREGHGFAFFASELKI